MRSLFVALCVCSLAIAARAQCTAIETRPCNGNGVCKNDVCVCNTVVDDVGVTTTFSGAKCEKFNSWWYTNETAPATCTVPACNNHGDHQASINKCKCKTYFDGNVTTQYSGPCCTSYFWYWKQSTSSSWSTGGNTTGGNGVTTCTSSSCSGHGTCSKGVCECSKITDGDRVTEYYGPTCNNWHSHWSWSWNSSWTQTNEIGTGQVWVSDGIGMRTSHKEWYCYCDGNSTTKTYMNGADNGAGVVCDAFCNATLTCNAHGTCNKTTQVCSCTGKFTGRWCDKCVEGWGNKNTSNNEVCNVCAPGYYPLTGSNMCTKQCWDNTTCSGHGTCKEDGSCSCKPGYQGVACSECKPSEGYHGRASSSCEVCDDDVHCSSAGICTKYGECQCGNGFTGPKCGNCSSSGKFPNCAGAPKRAAAANSECPGPNLALPIILSILGTLLVMLIAFAIYRMWAAKQAGAGGAGTAKSSNWSEFEKDSSTAYSQL